MASQDRADHPAAAVISPGLAREHLAQLAVSKPSVEDCAWIKAKAADLFQFVGAENHPELSKEGEAARRRSELIALGASENLFKALEAVRQCASHFESGKHPGELAKTMSILLRILRNICRDPAEAVRLVSDLHATHRIRDIIVTFFSDVIVCRDAFGVLANLAAPPANRQHVFSDCGAVLSSGLKRHIGDERLAYNGCACLVNLANDSSHLLEMGEICMKVIVDIGILHAKSEPVAENVASALSALLVEKSNGLRLLADGIPPVLDLITNLVRLHPKNVIVCEHGMRCLYLLSQVLENKLDFFQSNVLGAIKVALTECVAPGPAEWGCKLVRGLSHNNVEAKIRLQSQGVVEFVLVAVRSHSNLPSVVNCGLGALWSLANAPTNKAPMVAHGAHEVLINAMRLLPENVSVASTGVAGLASLANEPSVRKKLQKDGAFVSVIGVMRAHIEHVFVCEHGAGFVWAMCLDKDVLATASKDSQATKSLMQAITVHPNDTNVLEKVISALGVLATSNAGAETILRANGVAVLSSLVKIYVGKDALVTARLCHLLATVAYYCDDLDAFHRYGVAEIALDVLRTYPDEERCTRAAEKLLTSLEGSIRTVLPI